MSWLKNKIYDRAAIDEKTRKAKEELSILKDYSSYGENNTSIIEENNNVSDWAVNETEKVKDFFNTMDKTNLETFTGLSETTTNTTINSSTSSSSNSSSSSSSTISQFSELSDNLLDNTFTLQNGLSIVESSFGSFKSTTFGSVVLTVLKDILGAVNSTIFYKDGISETTFGAEQENSWSKFLSTSSSFVEFISDTPLGSPETSAVYGNMILGTPPLYTEITDPSNRTSMNTFIKDMRFLSLTPGMPKYNGGYTEQLIFSFGKSTYRNQTPDIQSMLAYLKKNGIDSDFSSKDKRYYTFQSKYLEYFAYLETMLNAVYIKMGLSSNADGSKDTMFNFFGNYINSDLKGDYKSALGFYLQGTPGITENVGNSTTGSGLENEVNSTSSEFQKMNYLTGMGSASGTALNIFKSAQRAWGGLVTQKNTIKGIGNEILSGVSGNGFFKGVAKLATNILDFGATNDLSALMQQIRATNGMKVVYPDMWDTSTYSKSMNFDFEFVSPYGDPLSIFHYVYVPFFALLTFALPRQADENGFVQPFFVRADVPGLMTCDLGIVSDISWTKGGQSGNLFTKDGLPRSIHVSITINDLYPFLAMTKRVSFLSANPSYTVFLDSMAGLHAIDDSTGSDDALNNYFKDMLNRITGDGSNIGRNKDGKLRNEYSNKIFAQARANGYRNSSAKSPSYNKGTYSTPWFTKK